MLVFHENSNRHKTAATMAVSLLNVADNKIASVDQQINKIYAEPVEQNRSILRSILDVIVVLGRKTLPLRGTYDKLVGKEDGNFPYFVELKSRFDHILSERVSSCEKMLHTCLLLLKIDSSNAALLKYVVEL